MARHPVAHRRPRGGRFAAGVPQAVGAAEEGERDRGQGVLPDPGEPGIELGARHRGIARRSEGQRDVHGVHLGRRQRRERGSRDEPVLRAAPGAASRARRSRAPRRRREARPSQPQRQLARVSRGTLLLWGPARCRREDFRAQGPDASRQDRYRRRRVVHGGIHEPRLAQPALQRRAQRRGAGSGFREPDE